MEIAGAFGGLAELPGGPARWIEVLQGLQDPLTGLFPDPAEGIPDDPLAWRLGEEFHHYGVLSVGYALEVLGAARPAVRTGPPVRSGPPVAPHGPREARGRPAQPR